MNRLILMCALMCTFIAFTACSSDEENQLNSALVENSKILASSEFQPKLGKLGEIPIDIEASATPEELSIFKKLSRKYRIDYSFYYSKRYPEMRDSMLRRLANAYNEADKTGTILVINTPAETRAISLLSVEEPNNSEVHYQYKQHTAFSNTNVSMSICVWVSTSAPYHLSSHIVQLSPSFAKFYPLGSKAPGSPIVYVTNGKYPYLYIDSNGYIKNSSYSYRVDNTVKYFIPF